MKKRNRKNRKTRYGIPVQDVEPTPAQTKDDNLTAYGGKRFRAPIRKDEFTHPAGTRPKAVILDIDGTLETWGATISPKVLEWVEKHHKAGHVLIVVTARTHEHSYDRSHDWLTAHLPYPFIGPFCRSEDDPRYSSEFKRETIETLSGLYDIVGAAEDNRYVIDMYRHHWGQDFDLLECGYGDYSGWRRDVSRYGNGYASDWSAYDAWESYTVGGIESQAVQEARISNRLDIEDQVYADYPDLSWPEIEAMDIDVLRQMIADTEADALVETTSPLDVEEVLGDLAEDEVA